MWFANILYNIGKEKPMLFLPYMTRWDQFIHFFLFCFVLTQLDHVKAEKGLLEMIDSPFIVNLVGFSQDEAHIYLLMDYVSGYGITMFPPKTWIRNIQLKALIKKVSFMVNAGVSFSHIYGTWENLTKILLWVVTGLKEIKFEKSYKLTNYLFIFWLIPKYDHMCVGFSQLIPLAFAAVLCSPSPSCIRIHT